MRERANGLLVVGGPVNVVHHKRIIAFAAVHKLPSISIARGYVDDGGLMSYGPSFEAIMAHTAGYVAHLEGRQTSRPPHRAAHEVRVGH